MLDFYWDKEALTEFVGELFEAPKGSLAREVADDWAELACEVNVNKLYNTPEEYE